MRRYDRYSGQWSWVLESSIKMAANPTRWKAKVDTKSRYASSVANILNSHDDAQSLVPSHGLTIDANDNKAI